MIKSANARAAAVFWIILNQRQLKIKARALFFAQIAAACLRTIFPPANIVDIKFEPHLVFGKFNLHPFQNCANRLLVPSGYSTPPIFPQIYSAQNSAGCSAAYSETLLVANIPLALKPPNFLSISIKFFGLP